ncbi:hypothetical protein F4778DRAFT_793050 [Xylariomycetidae sp. FL2044]|nr:hypothetical protein F4778DRAFT_793050 [Xylariomycetidae sp. FL2044]
MASSSTADNRPRVEDFGIRRKPFLCEPSPDSHEFEYMDSFIGEEVEWRYFILEKPDTDEQLCTYAMAIEKNTYITEFVNLLESFYDPESPRRTEMKYRDMVIDNYIGAGGDLSQLEYLAADNIVNPLAREAIEMAFQHRIKNPHEAQSEDYYPHQLGFGRCLREDPFVAGVQKILDKYPAQLGHATIKKFTLVSEGDGEGDGEDDVKGKDEPKYHIVVQLTR